MNSESEIHTPLPAGRDPILRLVPMPTRPQLCGRCIRRLDHGTSGHCGQPPGDPARPRTRSHSGSKFLRFQTTSVRRRCGEFYADIVKVGALPLRWMFQSMRSEGYARVVMKYASKLQRRC